MNLDDFIIKMCLLGPITYDTPFDESTLVFRIGGKIFLLTNIANWDSNEQQINLKATPEDVQNYLSNYSFVHPGYHMNKKHWITVDLVANQSSDLIFEWIKNSYDLVCCSLSKKVKSELNLNS